MASPTTTTFAVAILRSRASMRSRVITFLVSRCSWNSPFLFGPPHEFHRPYPTGVVRPLDVAGIVDQMTPPVPRQHPAAMRDSTRDRESYRAGHRAREHRRRRRELRHGGIRQPEISLAMTA